MPHLMTALRDQGPFAGHHPFPTVVTTPGVAGPEVTGQPYSVGEHDLSFAHLDVGHSPDRSASAGEATGLLAAAPPG
jgi:hypothetical protein